MKNHSNQDGGVQGSALRCVDGAGRVAVAGLGRHVVGGHQSGAVVRQAGASVHLDAEASWIEDSGETGAAHRIVAASVEWLLGIDVAEDLGVADGVAVDSVVIVEP